MAILIIKWTKEHVKGTLLLEDGAKGTQLFQVKRSEVDTLKKWEGFWGTEIDLLQGDKVKHTGNVPILISPKEFVFL